MQTDSPAVAEKKQKFSNDALLVAGAVIVASLIVSAVLYFPGNMTGSLGKGSDSLLPSAGEGANPTAAAPTDVKASASLDDDPVLGDRKKAKVAIIEFSDYECPFCKKFHEDTFGQLVKDYVDTGKAVIAFRDFPLSFHDPMATKEAGIAECIGAEKGDKVYFSFAQELYTNTQANGQGLPAGKLDELIRKAGADPVKIAACAETEAVKQEIQKDMADGTTAGISGTPSFVIGTLNPDGTVTGERVVGALPLSGFKEAIEKYLK